MDRWLWVIITRTIIPFRRKRQIPDQPGFALRCGPNGEILPTRLPAFLGDGGRPKHKVWMAGPAETDASSGRGGRAGSADGLQLFWGS